MVKHRKVSKYFENDCRPTLDLTPVIFNYYAFMIRLDKCNGGCNVVDHLSAKVCVLSETKSVNVKVFNMITRKNEAKKLVKDLLSHCKCKSDSKACNSNQKWNNKTCQCECKSYQTCKDDYSWNPSTFICENGKYSKSAFDDSMITCDEIINVIVYQQLSLVLYQQIFITKKQDM